MRFRKHAASVNRHIALCYIRQSFTRDSNDMNSPERQRANILAVCQRNAWTPEWYEDADGHKSGRFEANRPEWLRLKNRLSSPDVIALVANDQSRVHRKLARMSDLLDTLEAHGVRLVLAAPGRDLDTSTPIGRLLANFIAMQDEAYAADISQRQKDSAAYRRSQGKTLGQPPFGTVRDGHGYLMPSPNGAWLLPDGRFVAGQADMSPQDGAIWRSYYKCAELILTYYAQDTGGREKISYRMNQEGWPFEGRDGQPRPLVDSDIRRVTLCFPAYGGWVTGKRAKDLPGYKLEMDIDQIPFNAQRAVFPLDLLRKVAEVARKRSLEPADHGIVKKARAYPLAQITHCYHCEQRAEQQSNPRLRTRLGGTDKNGRLAYRHREGVVCGCTNRSVPCHVLEADFGRLLDLLTVSQDALNLMLELAHQLREPNKAQDEHSDFEARKQATLALCRRRIQAAIDLYGDGHITREEYLKRVEQNQREIAYWESRTSDAQKLSLELAHCMNALSLLARVWRNGTDEERRGMAHDLFSQIVYNLDTRRIVSFRLKPWAERFLVLRAALYGDEGGQALDENKTAPADNGLEQEVPLWGFEPQFQP